MPKLTEEDDIVSYLTMFERLMIAYEVSQDRWVYKLAANLVCKAQEAYAALSLESCDAMTSQMKVIGSALGQLRRKEMNPIEN